MYQFFHVDAYARTGSTQTKNGKTTITKSASDIASEAMRIDGFHPHVGVAKPPIILFGVDPREAVSAAENWAKTAKDAAGRALRRDGMCLLAGVVSIPAGAEIDWNDYKKNTIAYLRRKYGDNLMSVVEHTDENHPHLHFYAVPNEGEKFEILHEGIRARDAVRRDKTAAPGAANIAFKNAMRIVQDDFFNSVSVNYGMLRLGPKVQRLTRQEYNQQKKQAAALVIAKNKTIELEKNIEIKSNELNIINRKIKAANKSLLKESTKTIAEIFGETIRDVVNPHDKRINDAYDKGKKFALDQVNERVLPRYTKRINDLTEELALVKQMNAVDAAAAQRGLLLKQDIDKQKLLLEIEQTKVKNLTKALKINAPSVNIDQILGLK